MGAAVRLLLSTLLLGGCAATEPASVVERDVRERLGSHWDAMSPEQRECHLEAERAGHPAQYGDGTCESLL